MSRTCLYSLILGGVVGVSPAAWAQTPQTSQVSPTTHAMASSHRIFVFAKGGGFKDLRSFDSRGLADLRTGYNFGGGVGIELNNWASLRGELDFARDDARGAALAPAGDTHFDRYYYGVDAELRAPVESRLTPYLFVGGGAVTISPTNHDLLSPMGTQVYADTFTRAAGRVGVGLEYQPASSRFGLFAQAGGWLYNWNHYGYDRVQFDSNWSGGISYRFGRS